MAFTTPGTAVAGQVLSAAFWNSNVRDNTAFVKAETDVVGLKFISSTALSGVTTNISNVFSSTYDSYRVVISGLSSATGTVRSINIRLRTSSDDTTSQYNAFQTFVYGTSSTGASGSIGQTAWLVAAASNGGPGMMTLDIVNPNAAALTNYTGSATTFQADVSSFVFRTIGGVMNTGTQYTGFSIIGNTDALSGTVKVYGYRNS
jgi:hypothetical protein